MLETPDPAGKAAAAFAADALRLEGAARGESQTPPDRPARPRHPVLLPPSQVQRRGLGSSEGRAALLHAVAHIEFNAIDLAFDMAVRFAPAIAEAGLDADVFIRDWIRVGGEEARHFRLIEDRLDALGRHYGDLPAHDGLWEAAETTHHDALSRLVVAPLILEARGLDVTPDMIERLLAVGDKESAAALEIIYTEEVGHVACGKHWFDSLCAARGLNPADTFQNLRQDCFRGQLKPPFNHKARDKAGLPRSFYEPIGN